MGMCGDGSEVEEGRGGGRTRMSEARSEIVVGLTGLVRARRSPLSKEQRRADTLPDVRLTGTRSTSRLRRAGRGASWGKKSLRGWTC